MAKDLFSRFPRAVKHSTDRPDLIFVQESGYAVRDPQPDTLSAATLLLDDGTLAVFKGEPDKATVSGRRSGLTPVYALQPGGALAVPTGLVLIRFAEGIDAESRREELRNAGYEICRTLPYAPHAAWLCARSGEIADALAGIPVLEAIAGARNIEPQMVMESRRR